MARWRRGRSWKPGHWYDNSYWDGSKTKKSKSKKQGGSKSRGSRRGANRYSFLEALSLTMDYLSQSRAADEEIDDSELLDLDIPVATTDAGSNDVLLGTIRGHIVGVQYYSGTVNTGEMVTLVREPKNKYDRNAMKVENVWGQQVGHIKRELAEPLAYIVDNNYARVDGVIPSGGNNMFRIPVDISLWGPSCNKTVVAQRLRNRGFPLKESSGFTGMPSSSKVKKEPKYTYNPRSALGKSIVLSDTQMKNEVDTLFDNLQSLDKTTEREPAKCIISKMYPHQKQALNWMLARESDKNLPPFWDEVMPGQFRNSLTNFTSSKRPDCVRGGILADEMGLGKTLSVISLVLHEYIIPEVREDPSLPALPEGDSEDDDDENKKVEEEEKIEEEEEKVCVPLGECLPADSMNVVQEVVVINDSPEETATAGCSSTVIKDEDDGQSTSSRPKRASAANITYVISDDSDVSDEYLPTPEKKAKLKQMKSSKVKGQSAKGKGDKGKSIASSSSCPPTLPSLKQASSCPTLPLSQPHPQLQPMMSLPLQPKPLPQVEEPITAGVKGDGDGATQPHATLIVCPLSVISNWIDQFSEHVADEAQVSVHLYYGANRKKTKAKELAQMDVVITTYNTMAAEYKAKKEKAKLNRVEWLRIVLDEAHTIRNPGTLQTQAAHSLKAQRRWALTGTPIQNKMMDLWSLVAFLGLEPFKSSHNWWQRIISRPIAHNDARGIDRVRKLMDTMALRRMKTQKVNGKVLVDLPARNVVLQYVDLSEDETKVYKTMEKDGRLAVSKYFQQGTVLDHYGDILAILMRLRQLCCHPGLCARAAAKMTAMDGTTERTDEEQAELVATLVSFLSQGADEECCICLESLQEPVITRCAHVYCQKCIGDVILQEKEAARCPLCRRPISNDTLVHVPKDQGGKGQNGAEGEWHSSAKVDALMECLIRQRDVDKDTKSIVVSQFTSFLDLVEKPLIESGFTFTRLDGTMSSKQRTAAIRDFSRDEPDSPRVFLLSLKAGGVGLNLTAASRLYLLDPAWNPACEEQCFDRCHRLGQTKDVTITKFIVRDTVEVAMLELQERKRLLMKGVFGGKKPTAEERRASRIRDIKTLMGLNDAGALQN